MTIVEKLQASLEMLGGVASLEDIYSVFNQINKNDPKIPQPSIRARIYENCKTLDAYKGEDLFGSVYGRGKGIFSLKKFFRDEKDAQFIYETKEKRIQLWNKIKKNKSRNNRVLIKSSKNNRLNIHKGERGIYRDVKNTRVSIFKDGLALSVLDTGKVYDDVLSDTHLLYHYPVTSQTTTDLGEINSLKAAEKFNLPIFIVLGLEKNKSNKEIRFGYVKSHNDQRKTSLIEFKIDKKFILSPKFEEITETTEDEDDLPLFNSNKQGKQGYSKRRGNNQPKFSSDVFSYYENECAVCGINFFLDAAHIIPVKHRGSDNKKNGILLCKNHHKAFDDNCFKIDPKTLKIEFIENQSKLRILKNDINHLRNKPAKKYLEWRYKNY
tara:strand:- start:69 stop:1211 length:1143 start_codon:yes stop_codon:yes gene_type:complete